ncbi:MAG: hypothetical protein ACI9UK_001241 [Candidatus Krumholzibacteriia bacterium]|jgi:hypothetical protein
MKLNTATLFTVLLVLVAACTHGGEPAKDQPAASPEPIMVGQILLPNGSGSRGVEVRIEVMRADSGVQTIWVLFDEQGRFSHTIRGNLTSLRVVAGLGAEVHRIGTKDLPDINQAGQIDLGVIDLRDRLSRHRMMVRAADRRSQGEVRVAAWFGLPPVGPEGEPVSLGSRQFPSIAIGSEIEWLLSHDAHSIYFLVERPSDLSTETRWRSGRQQLFGPFNSAEIPIELILD